MSDTHPVVPSDIIIQGARSNNLKNITVAIPRRQLVVVTGVSGSGKSSLVMDTLFAEGQRRYVESLSSYARQFLTRMKKPEVDLIKGICPAIAIEQRVTTGNARSTVGSLTEVYEYLRLLYARIGVTYSPVSGRPVRKHEVSDIVDYLHTLPTGTRVALLAPLHLPPGRALQQELERLPARGITRLHYRGQTLTTDEALQRTDLSHDQLYILFDRFVTTADDPDNDQRIADSIFTALTEGQGRCLLHLPPDTYHTFSTRFELDGLEFEEPVPHLFNYNNPYGACPNCEGYGKVIGIDEDKVVPDKQLSVKGGAVACWRGEKGQEYLDQLLQNAHKFQFPVHTPYNQLTPEHRQLLWQGNRYFQGISRYFADLEAQTYKIQNRVLLARFRGRTTCPACGGSRLRREASYVRIADRTISELLNLPISQLTEHFEQLEQQLTPYQAQVARRLLLEINNRLRCMNDLGLGYLTLERPSATLSGGETQRINLTRTIGSNLTDSLYILDEPSIGLHPRDTHRLITVLHTLRNLGNTVVVVEHEEDIMKSADYLIDMGPAGGMHGGEVVFAGAYSRIFDQAAESLTTRYLNGSLAIPMPAVRRTSPYSITIEGATQHNLKDITVSFPLHTLTVVTGVSGSGKTTLVKQILYPALAAKLGDATTGSVGAHRTLSGDIQRVARVELINQSPIGKSSRSNPVTYVKAYDDIRELFAEQQLSKIYGFKARHFSFNVEGGRCDTCNGEGETVVEMQFLADVHLTCESCGGKRFKPEVLEVTYRSKNIHEVLELTVEQALEFFANEKNIIQKLRPLHDVGLGYVRLGQASGTLSGGEAQRVKLASFLQHRQQAEHILFIFDEPTTGLHFHDIRQLLDALQALVENGHTVIVVEHNQEVIKCADWVIDLGPEGGHLGGHLVAQGTPEQIAAHPRSHTGRYLLTKMQQVSHRQPLSETTKSL